MSIRVAFDGPHAALEAVHGCFMGFQKVLEGNAALKFWEVSKGLWDVPELL